jgi:hypothetical protein
MGLARYYRIFVEPDFLVLNFQLHLFKRMRIFFNGNYSVKIISSY